MLDGVGVGVGVGVGIGVGVGEEFYSAGLCLGRKKLLVVNVDWFWLIWLWLMVIDCE